jgi:hypothetical protein|nr:MAG TPA: hypothetical protein [Caudoviricetes sp.]
MGLDISVKGLERKDTYHCGYIKFNLYRKKVASAYNERLGELYKKTFKDELQPEEIKEWNNLCNNDLDIFLWHSDCDGKLTPKECKKIYDAMKDLKVEMQGHNYIEMNYYDMHQLWLNMLKHCYKHRVNMYFY